MSSRRCIEQTIQKLGDLIEDVWTGNAKFENVDAQYQSLRRRLYALKPILGAPPEFLNDSEDLWKLWHNTVKGILKSYEERRQFLNKNYRYYFRSILDRIEDRSFEEELVFRDLAIIRQLGEGGFGVVYEAEHVVLQEKRAVKKLEPIFANENDLEKALRRFSREAQILSRLSHPNIVRFVDAGMAGEHPFIIMEYIEGYDLRTIVSRDGVLAPSTARQIMFQVLDAVAVAHKAGIVHRDIKPTNVMWDGQRAVVLDYGASQWLEQQLSTRMTTTAVGTPGYIASELFENPQSLDPKLDCYSLGVVHHFLLTGRIPIAGDATHYMKAQGLTQDIQSFILKAIAPQESRFSDGSEMRNALELTA